MLAMVIVLLVLGIVAVYLSQSLSVKNLAFNQTLETPKELSYREVYQDDNYSKTNSQGKIYQGINDFKQDMSDYEKRIESLE